MTSTAVTTWTAPDGGWSSDGTEDLPTRHPMISLTPPIKGTKEMPAGEFFHSDTEKSTPSLDVVILYVREERVMFEEGSTEPVCRSADGKTPVEGMPLWDMERVTLKQGPVIVPNFPGACGRCPFSEWEDGKAPPCGNGYVLLVDRGDGDLAQMRVKGTSIKPFKDFVARKPRRFPLYFFRVHITSEDRTKGQNRWFELRFKAEMLEEAEARKYDRLLKEQAHRFDAEEDRDDLPEPTAFDAELDAVLESYFLKRPQLAKFMKMTVTEENVRTFMADNNYAELDALVAAVQRESDLPFSED